MKSMHGEPSSFRFSIIVPVLNEIKLLPDLVEHLSHWQQCGCEVLIVDGGSCDGTKSALEAAGLTVINSEPGRAIQMNNGARHAKGNVLIFLHADSRLPENALQAISNAAERQQQFWGRFDVAISGEHFMLNVIAWFMNRRSRLTSIATGDQAIFVSRSAFDDIGGFPRQPLMEDIEISRKLRQKLPPLPLDAKVVTSGRRWLDNGIWRTILLMWRLRLAYWCGASACQLAKKYQ